MSLTDNLTGLNSNYLKGKDFELGMDVKIFAKPELVEANDPKYGIKEGEHEGKTVRWVFEVDGEVRTFENHSRRLVKAMQNFDIGDEVTLTRTGVGVDTNWEAVKK